VIETFPGQSLDLLINNAGVMALPKREVTADGFERQFATNDLGPFALTELPLPSIKAKPRIARGDFIEWRESSRKDRLRQSTGRAGV
jgi:NAD(P)-dependent dehydrogenase (short-subunit alcohol dehydrogenase family)